VFITGWLSFANFNVKAWKNTYLEWINACDDLCPDQPPYLIIFYEELVADPIAQLKKIVKYLGYGDIPRDRLQCLQKYPNGRFYRKHNKEKEPEPCSRYSDQLKRMINGVVKQVADAFKLDEGRISNYTCAE
jgi:hypothetical protein